MNRLRIAWRLLWGKPVWLNVGIPFKIIRTGVNDRSKIETWHFKLVAINQAFVIQLAQDRVRDKKQRLAVELRKVSDPRTLL